MTESMRDGARAAADRTPANSEAGPATPGRAGLAGAFGGRCALPYRAEMEAAYGESFGDVAVSLGCEALVEVGAEGAAYGNAIAFRSSTPDRAVVAHELAHVTQFRRSHIAELAFAGDVADETADAEREADAAADAVLHGRRPAISARPAGAVHLARKRTTARAHRYDKRGAPNGWNHRDHREVDELVGTRARPDRIPMTEDVDFEEEEDDDDVRDIRVDDHGPIGAKAPGWRAEDAQPDADEYAITPTTIVCNEAYRALLVGDHAETRSDQMAYVANVPTTLHTKEEFKKNAGPLGIATAYESAFASKEDAASRFCLVIGMNVRRAKDRDVGQVAAMEELAAEIEAFSAFPVAVICFLWSAPPKQPSKRKLDDGKHETKQPNAGVPHGMIRSFMRDYAGVTRRALHALNRRHRATYLQYGDSDIVDFSNRPPQSDTHASPLFDRYDRSLARDRKDIVSGGYLFRHGDKTGEVRDPMQAYMGWDSMLQRDFAAMHNSHFPYYPEANLLVRASDPLGDDVLLDAPWGIYDHESSDYLKNLRKSVGRDELEGSMSFDLDNTLVTNGANQTVDYRKPKNPLSDEGMTAYHNDAHQSTLSGNQFYRRLHTAYGVKPTAMGPLSSELAGLSFPQYQGRDPEAPMSFDRIHRLVDRRNDGDAHRFATSALEKARLHLDDAPSDEDVEPYEDTTYGEPLTAKHAETNRKAFSKFRRRVAAIAEACRTSAPKHARTFKPLPKAHTAPMTSDFEDLLATVEDLAAAAREVKDTDLSRQAKALQIVARKLLSFIDQRSREERLARVAYTELRNDPPKSGDDLPASVRDDMLKHAAEAAALMRSWIRNATDPDATRKMLDGVVEVSSACGKAHSNTLGGFIGQVPLSQLERERQIEHAEHERKLAVAAALRALRQYVDDNYVGIKDVAAVFESVETELATTAESPWLIIRERLVHKFSELGDQLRRLISHASHQEGDDDREKRRLDHHNGRVQLYKAIKDKDWDTAFQLACSMHCDDPVTTSMLVVLFEEALAGDFDPRRYMDRLAGRLLRTAETVDFLGQLVEVFRKHHHGKLLLEKLVVSVDRWVGADVAQLVRRMMAGEQIDGDDALPQSGGWRYDDGDFRRRDHLQEARDPSIHDTTAKQEARERKTPRESEEQKHQREVLAVMPSFRKKEWFTATEHEDKERKEKQDRQEKEKEKGKQKKEDRRRADRDPPRRDRYGDSHREPRRDGHRRDDNRGRPVDRDAKSRREAERAWGKSEATLYFPRGGRGNSSSPAKRLIPDGDHAGTYTIVPIAGTANLCLYAAVARGATLSQTPEKLRELVIAALREQAKGDRREQIRQQIALEIQGAWDNSSLVRQVHQTPFSSESTDMVFPGVRGTLQRTLVSFLYEDQPKEALAMYLATDLVFDDYFEALDGGMFSSFLESHQLGALTGVRVVHHHFDDQQYLSSDVLGSSTPRTTVHLINTTGGHFDLLERDT